MLYAIAIILLAVWLVGLLMLKTVSGIFHILLGLAVVTTVWAFLRGRRSKLT
jgi:hypothetical protein